MSDERPDWDFTASGGCGHSQDRAGSVRWMPERDGPRDPATWSTSMCTPDSALPARP